MAASNQNNMIFELLARGNFKEFEKQLQGKFPVTISPTIDKTALGANIQKTMKSLRSSVTANLFQGDKIKTGSFDKIAQQYAKAINSINAEISSIRSSTGKKETNETRVLKSIIDQLVLDMKQMERLSKKIPENLSKAGTAKVRKSLISNVYANGIYGSDEYKTSQMAQEGVIVADTNLVVNAEKTKTKAVEENTKKRIAAKKLEREATKKAEEPVKEAERAFKKYNNLIDKTQKISLATAGYGARKRELEKRGMAVGGKLSDDEALEYVKVAEQYRLGKSSLETIKKQIQSEFRERSYTDKRFKTGKASIFDKSYLRDERIYKETVRNPQKVQKIQDWQAKERFRVDPYSVVGDAQQEEARKRIYNTLEAQLAKIETRAKSISRLKINPLDNAGVIAKKTSMKSSFEDEYKATEKTFKDWLKAYKTTESDMTSAMKNDPLYKKMQTMRQARKEMKDQERAEKELAKVQKDALNSAKQNDNIRKGTTKKVQYSKVQQEAKAEFDALKKLYDSPQFKTAQRDLVLQKNATKWLTTPHEVKVPPEILEAQQRVTRLDELVLKLRKDFKAAFKEEMTPEIEKRVIERVVQDYDEIGRSVGVAGHEQEKHIGKLVKTKQAVHSLGTDINLTFKKMLLWQGLGGLFFGAIRQFQQGLAVLKQIDTELIEIAKVTNKSKEEMIALAKSATVVAQSYGRTTTDYLSAVSTFSKAGLKTQAEDYAKLSLLMQNIGDVAADTANQTLIAANAGFKLNNSYQALMKTMDAMNEISNNNATTVGKMSEAIKVGASIAQMSEVSFNEFIALVGTATAVTQREGSEIGRALRTITMNIRAVTNEDAEVTGETISATAKKLRSIGVEVAGMGGELRPVMDVLSDLAAKWKDLTDQQKSMIAEGVANKRQANILVGVMENWTMVQKQLNEAINSGGSALKENKIYMDSWQAKANEFTSQVTALWQNFLPTDLVKNVIEAGTWIVKTLDDIGMSTALVTAGIVLFLAKTNLGTAIVFDLSKVIATNLARSFLTMGASLNVASAAAGTLSTVLATFIPALIIGALAALVFWVGTAAKQMTEFANDFKSARDELNVTKESIDSMTQTLINYKEKFTDSASGIVDMTKMTTTQLKEFIGTELDLRAALGDTTNSIDFQNKSLEDNISAIQRLTAEKERLFLLENASTISRAKETIAGKRGSAEMMGIGGFDWNKQQAQINLGSAVYGIDKNYREIADRIAKQSGIKTTDFTASDTQMVMDEYMQKYGAEQFKLSLQQAASTTPGLFEEAKMQDIFNAFMNNLQAASDALKEAGLIESDLAAKDNAAKWTGMEQDAKAQYGIETKPMDIEAWKLANMSKAEKDAYNLSKNEDALTASLLSSTQVITENKDALSELNGVMENMNDSTYRMSSEELVSLLEKYPQLTQYVEDSAGGYRINKDGLEALRQERILEMETAITSAESSQATVLSSVQAQLGAYATLGEAIEALSALDRAAAKEKFVKDSILAKYGAVGANALPRIMLAGLAQDYGAIFDTTISGALDTAEKIAAQRKILEALKANKTKPDSSNSSSNPNEFDAYLDLQNILDTIEAKLSDINAQREAGNLTLQESLELDKKQIQLLEDKKKALSDYNNRMRKERTGLIPLLQKYGIKFSGEGDEMTIANAIAVLNAKKKTMSNEEFDKMYGNLTRFLEIQQAIIANNTAMLGQEKEMADVLKEKADSLQEIYDLYLKLKNTQNERNTRVLRKDESGNYNWNWEADQKEIRDIQGSLGDALSGMGVAAGTVISPELLASLGTLLAKYVPQPNVAGAAGTTQNFTIGNLNITADNAEELINSLLQIFNTTK